MVRAELVSKLAKEQEMTKKQADTAVKAVLEVIVESLSNGEKVELRGFGSFTIKDRAARKSRNPKTGETVDVPAKIVPFFKTGQDLKIIG